MEELLYNLKHPEAAATSKTSSADATKTSSAAESEAAKSYTAQTTAATDATAAGSEFNISL